MPPHWGIKILKAVSGGSGIPGGVALAHLEFQSGPLPLRLRWKTLPCQSSPHRSIFASPSSPLHASCRALAALAAPLDAPLACPASSHSLRCSIPVIARFRRSPRSSTLRSLAPLPLIILAAACLSARLHRPSRVELILFSIAELNQSKLGACL